VDTCSLAYGRPLGEAKAVTRPILVLCTACGGEGRILHGEYDRGWDERCPTCEGTGGELLEPMPVECEDLGPLIPANERAAPKDGPKSSGH
jgi:DnaJ-class molecular chaperone